MNRLLALTGLAALSIASLPAQAPDQPAAKEQADEPEATDFIRIVEDEKASRLQTGVVRYEKDGVAVTLVGAVHVGDKKSYQQLNESFKNYDVLLFELVGGERMVDGKLPEGDGGDAQTRFLRGMVEGMSRFLQLSSQMTEIDYSPRNFVHADLTMKQFTKKQDANGESILSFALAAAQNAENQGVDQPDPAKLLAALLSGNSNGIKLEMMKTLGQGDDQIAALTGNNVIIGQRNAKCFKILRKQIKKGHKNLGIFYGAAHFPDMEKRLLKMGYQRTKVDWMTAWDVPKPAPRAKPKEEEEGEADTEKKKKAA